MTSLAWRATLLVLFTLALSGFMKAQPIVQSIVEAQTGASVPIQTDDGADPITLIFTGYAPSWWVASNLAGWSDSSYCSGPKTVGGAAYNYTLEHPDPTGLPCFGPRDHIRIWDMGYSSVFGEWSVASTHHEHTVCDPICHHVIDSWDRAESDARASFLNGPATLSVSNYPLPNSGYYQGVFNDGNATLIELKPPSGSYPVVFTENGLSNRTSWSVTVNGTTVTSARPAMVFVEPNGTYLYTVGTPSGFNSSPSSGRFMINGSGAIQNVVFRTPWTTSTVTFNSARGPMSIGFRGNATISPSSVQISTAGDTVLAFSTTEIGSIGALNVTIPRSIATSATSISVYIDGTRNASATISNDDVDYYAYLLLSYGTHTIELRFSPIGTPYVDYLIGSAIAAVILGAVFLKFKSRMLKKTKPAASQDTHAD